MRFTRHHAERPPCCAVLQHAVLCCNMLCYVATCCAVMPRAYVATSRASAGARGDRLRQWHRRRKGTEEEVPHARSTASVAHWQPHPHAKRTQNARTQNETPHGNVFRSFCSKAHRCNTTEPKRGSHAPSIADLGIVPADNKCGACGQFKPGISPYPVCLPGHSATLQKARLPCE